MIQTRGNTPPSSAAEGALACRELCLTLVLAMLRKGAVLPSSALTGYKERVVGTACYERCER